MSKPISNSKPSDYVPTHNAPTPSAAPPISNSDVMSASPHARTQRIIADPSEALEETLKSLNPVGNHNNHGS